MRSQLFAIATVALSGVFTVLMFRSLKLVADAWFIGCVFHADGSKTCRWDVAWLPDPCLPPLPPPPPNTLGGSNGTLMHALFMSLAFGLLTPIGSISFTVRAAAWPSALLLAPGALPLAHHHPSGLRDSTRRLGASEGGEAGAGGGEREGVTEPLPLRGALPNAPIEVSTFHRSGETLRLSPLRARAAHGVLMTAALLLSVLGLLQQWYAHGG